MTGRIGKRIVLLTFRRGSSARILNKNNEKCSFQPHIFLCICLKVWFDQFFGSLVLLLYEAVFSVRDIFIPRSLFTSDWQQCNQRKPFFRVRSMICPRNLPYLIPVTNSISKETSSINRMFILKTMFKADFLHVVILYQRTFGSQTASIRARRAPTISSQLFYDASNLELMILC